MVGHWRAVKIIHDFGVRSPQAKVKMAAFTCEVTILKESNIQSILCFKEVFDKVADICESF